jgi:hypothetical protein
MAKRPLVVMQTSLQPHGDAQRPASAARAHDAGKAQGRFTRVRCTQRLALFLTLSSDALHRCYRTSEARMDLNFFEPRFVSSLVRVDSLTATFSTEDEVSDEADLIEGLEH